MATPLRIKASRPGRASIAALVALTIALTAASLASAAPILQGGTENSTSPLAANYMDGYDFTPSSNLSVTALGFWDYGSDGLPSAFQVGLWQTSSQTLLASATIDNGDPIDGSLVVNGGSWRYEALSAEVPLASGVQYTLAFQVGINNMSGADVLLLQPSSLSTFPGVTVAGTFRNMGTASFTFPTGSSSYGFIPGLVNAQVVPEPASLFLVGTGLVGLAAYGRRRKGAA